MYTPSRAHKFIGTVILLWMLYQICLSRPGLVDTGFVKQPMLNQLLLIQNTNHVLMWRWERFLGSTLSSYNGWIGRQLSARCFERTAVTGWMRWLVDRASFWSWLRITVFKNPTIIRQRYSPGGCIGKGERGIPSFFLSCNIRFCAFFWTKWTRGKSNAQFSISRL